MVPELSASASLTACKKRKVNATLHSPVTVDIIKFKCSDLAPFRHGKSDYWVLKNVFWLQRLILRQEAHQIGLRRKESHTHTYREALPPQGATLWSCITNNSGYLWSRKPTEHDGAALQYLLSISHCKTNCWKSIVYSYFKAEQVSDVNVCVGEKENLSTQHNTTAGREPCTMNTK